jgi:hypothetical protein
MEAAFFACQQLMHSSGRVFRDQVLGNLLPSSHHAIFKISGIMLWELAGSVEAADDMPIAVSDNMASSDDQWLNINHLGFHNSGSKLLVVQRISESDWYLLWS